jgi:hypothetical protein
MAPMILMLVNVNLYASIKEYVAMTLSGMVPGRPAGNALSDRYAICM